MIRSLPNLCLPDLSARSHVTWTGIVTDLNVRETIMAEPVWPQDICRVAYKTRARPGVSIKTHGNKGFIVTAAIKNLLFLKGRKRVQAFH